MPSDPWTVQEIGSAQILMRDWQYFLDKLCYFLSVPRNHSGLTRVGERCPCGAVGPHDEDE